MRTLKGDRDGHDVYHDEMKIEIPVQGLLKFIRRFFLGCLLFWSIWVLGLYVLLASLNLKGFSP